MTTRDVAEPDAAVRRVDMDATVVIVSRNRPRSLRLCLAGLFQQDHGRFDIVVVTDPASAAGLAHHDGMWVLTFDEPNISAARNLGVAAAGAGIVAFIDDDAVPEPTWLTRLTAPLADPSVVATGGHVLGRNGISLQWGGRRVDAMARDHDIAAADAPVRIDQGPGLALKTEGTNMAFRRSALAAIGGFDPALRFYLDEADVNLRLAATGAPAVLVPLAQVHHGFAASDQRRADRVPLSLHEVGASLAVFLRKHAGGADPRRFAEEACWRRRALIAHMVAGRIEPRDVDRILATLRAGWDDGMRRPLPPPPPLASPALPFRPFRPAVPWQGDRVLAGGMRERDRLEEEAARLTAAGWRVSLYLFSRTARPHRAGFHAPGYWLQTGGLYGRADRKDPPVARWTRDARLAHEVARVAPMRNSGGISHGKDGFRPF